MSFRLEGIFFQSPGNAGGRGEAGESGRSRLYQDQFALLGKVNLTNMPTPDRVLAGARFEELLTSSVTQLENSLIDARAQRKREYDELAQTAIQEGRDWLMKEHSPISPLGEEEVPAFPEVPQPSDLERRQRVVYTNLLTLQLSLGGESKEELARMFNVSQDTISDRRDRALDVIREIIAGSRENGWRPSEEMPLPDSAVAMDLLRLTIQFANPQRDDFSEKYFLHGAIAKLILMYARRYSSAGTRLESNAPLNVAGLRLPLGIAQYINEHGITTFSELFGRIADPQTNQTFSELRPILLRSFLDDPQMVELIRTDHP